MGADEAPLVPLGALVGAHGVRGELRVKLFNPESDLLEQLGEVLLQREGDAEPHLVAITAVRRHKQGLLLSLEGCESREDAEALRGYQLCVPRAALPPLEDGEHYLIDLIGLRALRPDGSEVGEIVDVFEYPASQVLRVAVEGGTLEIPHLPPYLVEVRLDNGVVVVDELDDLEVERPRVRKH